MAMEIKTDIGMNIAPNVRVTIGEGFAELEQSLIDNEIDYDVASGKQFNEGDRDMLIVMRDYGVELRLLDNIIIFIRSNNPEANFVMQLDDFKTPFDSIGTIRNTLASWFGVDVTKIVLRDFNQITSDTTLTAYLPNNDAIRLSLVMGAGRKLYLRSISLL